MLHGDPSDRDFWDRVEAAHTLKLVMLALPRQSTTLTVLERLHEAEFTGNVAATARYPDELDLFRNAGATTVFNLYTEAGMGFAAHVRENLPGIDTPANSAGESFSRT